MKYLLNKTDSTLVIGYMEIGPGKYDQITDGEVESPEVVYAVRNKWATVSDKEPKEIDFGKEEMVFEVPSTAGSEVFPGKDPDLVAVTSTVIAEDEPEADAKDVPVEAETPAVEETAAAKKSTRKPKGE